MFDCLWDLFNAICSRNTALFYRLLIRFARLIFRDGTAACGDPPAPHEWQVTLVTVQKQCCAAVHNEENIQLHQEKETPVRYS